jgi:uncharacterized damage-inducible protein DinB
MKQSPPLDRRDPPEAVPEKEMVAAFLDYHRATLLWKAEGVSDADLDDRARAPRTHPRGGEQSLRWIVLHMIEETARHNGHADIMREAIDGATGE